MASNFANMNADPDGSKSLAVRLGLVFADRSDERAFTDAYVRGAIGQCQTFMVLAALCFYIFFLWDRIMDPVHAETAHAVRGLIVTPITLLCTAAMWTGWGQRRIEALILFAYAVGQIGLVYIYSVLDRGYDYAVVGFIILFMAMATAMPLRTAYIVLGAVLCIVSTAVGHMLAGNAQPGWLVINMLAIVTAVGFATVATFLRERRARQQFLADRELASARNRVDDLLYSILPREIAQRIQAGEGGIADSLGEVSIVFIDMVGFTKHSRNASASELTNVLGQLFSAFDAEAARHGIDKIKTIGDAYMAIGGLERGAASHDHAINAAAFALSVQEVVKRLAPTLPWPIEVRIGIHVGPVVAGVIGVHRPAFDCWGESVNLAARLERQAPPGKIVVSESAYWRLRRAFRIEPFKTIALKGIGTTPCYLLEDRLAGRTGLIFESIGAIATSSEKGEGSVIAEPAAVRLEGFASAETQGLTMFQRLLAAIGLRFTAAEDETAFTEYFVNRSLRIFQYFIFAAGLSFCSFFTWDQIVDPANASTAIMIRVAFVLPLTTICALLLFIPRFQRNLEWMILGAYTAIQIGQSWIYTILSHGYDYVVMGFVLITLAMATCFPIRAKFVALAAAIAFSLCVGGHLIAGNARPGWLLINVMAVGAAMIFGVLAAYFRERAGRMQFMTERAIAASRARADELLESILPADIVRRIQSGETAIADALKSVSLVCADLAGFTALSRQLSPPDLIRLLNTLFSRFDAIASKHGMERIKTIGDAYIAIGGMNSSQADHPADAARFALAIRAAALETMRETDYPINIRIAVHTGPVIAGVIGVRRPTFDCWGDTVVYASALESAANPGTILVSASLAETLQQNFDLTPIDDVAVGSAPPGRVWELQGARKEALAA